MKLPVTVGLPTGWVLYFCAQRTFVSVSWFRVLRVYVCFCVRVDIHTYILTVTLLCAGGGVVTCFVKS